MAEIFPNEGLDLIYAGYPKGATGPANTWVGLFTSWSASTVAGSGAVIASWAEVSVAGAYVRATIASSSWGTVGTTQSGRGSGAAQVTFATATAVWGTTNGFIICSGATGGAGTVWFGANYDDTTAVVVNTNDVIKVTPTWVYTGYMGLEEAIQNIWASDYVQKNPNKAYKVSYANEYTAVAGYLNGGAEPNWAGFSKLGKGLCEAEKERRLAAEPEPEPPPVGTKLAWAPPTLNNPVRMTLTNANRMSNELLSGGGRDLLITCGEVLTGPIQQTNNWRHVVAIGGEINIPGTGDNYAWPLSSTGVTHIEGWHIHGDGVSDAFMTRGGSASAVVQIQNCRVQAHYKGGEHADCFQTQGNTKVNALRFHRVTLITDYQGIFLRLSPQDAFLNGGDWRQINWRRGNPDADPRQAYFFLSDEDPATGHPPGPMIGPIAISDAWMETPNPTSNWVIYPGWLFETALENPALGKFGNREGVFRESDAISEYLRPSTPSDVVPPGGSASGKPCEPAGWTGKIRLGVPPGGDFCPASVPGVGYSSPGYL